MLPHELSTEAEDDLEDIYLYGLTNFGTVLADRYIEVLYDRIDIICRNPLIGRLDSRVIPPIRRFECESHVIFYDLHENLIFIVRILHGMADFVQNLNS